MQQVHAQQQEQVQEQVVAIIVRTRRSAPFARCLMSKHFCKRTALYAVCGVCQAANWLGQQLEGGCTLQSVTGARPAALCLEDKIVS